MRRLSKASSYRAIRFTCHACQGQQEIPLRHANSLLRENSVPCTNCREQISPAVKAAALATVAALVDLAELENVPGCAAVELVVDE